ncbi:MAG: hypothetical protein NC930_08690, partial [Candidatus Omnitrophica bacterium]|nr:hypothetical protein [Candidatus Omnitrophota bacterium]
LAAEQLDQLIRGQDYPEAAELLKLLYATHYLSIAPHASQYQSMQMFVSRLLKEIEKISRLSASQTKQKDRLESSILQNLERIKKMTKPAPATKKAGELGPTLHGRAEVRENEQSVEDREQGLPQDLAGPLFGMEEADAIAHSPIRPFAVSGISRAQLRRQKRLDWRTAQEILRSAIGMMAEQYTQYIVPQYVRRTRGEGVYRIAVRRLAREALGAEAYAATVAARAQSLEDHIRIPWIPEKQSKALRVLGIKSPDEIGGAYIVGAGFAIEYGGLSVLYQLFGERSFVVIGNAQEQAIVQKYNEEVLIPAGKSPIRVADNAAEANAALIREVHDRGGVSPSAYRIKGLLGTGDTEFEAALIQEIGEANVDIIGSHGFDLITQAAGVEDIVNEFKARFHLEKSA